MTHVTDALAPARAPQELSQGRRRCPHCDKRCPGWCYQCCVPLVDGFPRLTLPFRFTVLMHPGESAARNTAGHAPVLAPEHCTLVRGFEELAELPRHAAGCACSCSLVPPRCDSSPPLAVAGRAWP